MIDRKRASLGGLVITGALLVSLAQHEGWMDTAAPPVKGDVCTNGFGTTRRPDGTPVPCGEKVTPPVALDRLLTDVSRFDARLKQCIRVPLAQHEYDAYLSLAYNIGPANFCGSTLVKKLNTTDYAGACAEILRWDKFKGQPLPGLTRRRQAEYRQCLGPA